MQIEGDYRQDGYALVRGLIPKEVARAFMGLIRDGLQGQVPKPNYDAPILVRPSVDIAGKHYAPMQTFLWGLTPAMEQVAGCALLPTYDYFRFYREGDICKIHRDRPACEHSLSLTLDYSDDAPWALEVGKLGAAGPDDIFADDFAGEPSAALAMEIGDGVAYRGVEHRHGRTSPNPNGWSAHLFMHWVERDGPFAGEPFDGAGLPEPANFKFAEG